MRLSTVLELLLIFLLIAFAAYGRVIEPTSRRAIEKKPTATISHSKSPSLKQATDTVNKYCVCNENICNCCRDFHIPLVQLSGPGCASLQYLQDDKLAMQLNIGDNILSSNIISGKNPKPVCVDLPGGFSKFCGKIYSIKREADKHFKACLGLELRSATELEASLRVSCFRFGPDGLKLRPAEPLPAATLTESSASSDDDYDDFFGLDDDEDDDDDDEDYERVSPQNNVDPESATNEQQDPEQEEDDEDDLLGFGALFDIFTGGEESSANKKTKVTTTTPIPSSFSIPLLKLTSTAAPTNNKLPVSKSPHATSSSPATTESIPSAASAADPAVTSIPNSDDNENVSEIDRIDPAEATTKVDIETTISNIDIGITETTPNFGDVTNKITVTNKIDTKRTNKTKLKNTKVQNKKKISITSQSVNNIKDDTIKPQISHPSTTVGTDLNEDDDEYDYSDSVSDEENEEIVDSNEENLTNAEGDKNESDKHHADAEEIANEDDDYEEDEDDDEEEEEEEEEAVLSALVDDEEKKESISANHQSKKRVNTTNKSTDLQEDDTDYTDELTDLLARKHQIRTINHKKSERKIARQSKVMKF